MGSLERAILTGFICRVCSKMKKVVVHIYGEEGLRIKLAEKLQVLGLDIYCDDQLPKTVCNTCISKLLVHFEWMEKIRRNQQHIQDLIHKSNQTGKRNSL